MMPRYKAEARNKYRLDNALKQGQLEDYWFLVASPCSDDMTEEELDQQGFFAPTKSMAFQATTLRGGKIIMESAFVAGVRSEGGTRHDFATLNKLGSKFGVDLTGSAAQIIDKPLLIHKSLMPNGVIDVVRLYDDLAGGTFFGEDKPRQDYLAFLDKCEAERKEAEIQVRQMVGMILSRAPEATDPVSATELLNRVVGGYMAKASVKDERIDPRVFGVEAAFYIADARTHLAAGDYERVQMLTRLAVNVERSSSCPGAARRNAADTDGITDITDIESAGSLAKESSEVADCDFISKECPMCKRKNVKTTVKSGVYYGECGCDSVHGKAITKRDKEPSQKQASNAISIFSRNKSKTSKDEQTKGRTNPSRLAIQAA